MIVDLRIYTCLPNKVPAFLRIYEEKAWPLQLQYLQNCVGWYTTIEGELNTIVHMWGYASQGEREQRRNALAADPAWGDYLKAVAESGALIRMENRILRRTPFFEAHMARAAG